MSVISWLTLIIKYSGEEDYDDEGDGEEEDVVRSIPGSPDRKA